jgi:hypothetical protein
MSRSTKPKGRHDLAFDIQLFVAHNDAPNGEKAAVIRSLTAKYRNPRKMP